MSKANSWKKRGQASLTCPSGEVVTIRRVTLGDLPSCAHLPAPLLAKVMEKFEHMDAKEKETKRPPTIEEMQNLPDLVDAMLIACLIEPRAVAGIPTDEDTISVDDIPTQDRIFLFNAAQQNFPQVPVATEGGATSIEALTEFHTEAGVSDALHDGAGTPTTPESSLAAGG